MLEKIFSFKFEKKNFVGLGEFSLLSEVVGRERFRILPPTLGAVVSERFSLLPRFTRELVERGLRFYLKSRLEKRKGVWGVFPNSM